MKKKFRELRLKNSNEQKTITQLSGCIQEKFDGFNIICVEYSKKLRKKFNPINIINKPVKQPEKKIYAIRQQIFQELTKVHATRVRKIKYCKVLPMNATC